MTCWSLVVSGKTAKGHRLCFDFNLKEMQASCERSTLFERFACVCGVKGCQKNRPAL